jgi:hypothetical protein
MRGDGKDDQDLLRRFEAAISGMELDDLRRLAAELPKLAGAEPTPAGRPTLRRQPRGEVANYRLRVDLDHARPPIWRRLDLRSDVSLDVVHQVLQAAFGWTDSHLHRFALGGGPFDRHSELFLCPFDVEDGEDAGTAACDVRLDETLHDPGDVLRYVYDYGDSWELTMRLEEVLAAGDRRTPLATCVDGRRSAPPEDCGGITEAVDLARVLEDPAVFDVDEVNQALQEPFFVLCEYGVHPRLVHLVNRLRFTPVGEDISARTLTLASSSPEPSSEEKAAALRAHRWFLDRADGSGIELTSAGYLKPADVEAASAVVPAMGDWIGRNTREIHAAPILDFRRTLQSMGLLRKYKGKLLLARAGSAARRSPEALWRHLSSRLVPSAGGTFAEEASLLLLAYASTSPDASLPLGRVAEALEHLGWTRPGGEPLHSYDLYRLDAFVLLRNVSAPRVCLGDHRRISPIAASLARAALLPPGN